ncbi:RAMP superfamily CRISPR-associated protein [Flavivirga jejuensis]|uniref:RAMP superfamily CRISPR-associated protein n=1 Tax=Flavivirga jejuensis TaxID=870487 RepID=A0ABT8WUV8_9FLAO|nr:RAMP superfamily CRISPR-associated protein [Flavivirga jejuensis]MDO5976943.1 RAMP superfamily CRISPR-associated protein [Flavivirga jejuensis]
MFPIKYIAQIVVEAISPLAIGSDTLAYDQDNLVVKDCNNLPCIPGTAIAGFLRVNNNEIDALFGDDRESNKKQPVGSNICVSDGFLLGKDQKVIQEPQIITCDFLKKYENLPIRQHTAISHLGAAKNTGMFDTEIVFKGSCFKFQIELELEKENSKAWQAIKNTLLSNNFYIGASEFNNFGELQVVELKDAEFNIANGLELKKYLGISADLNSGSDSLKVVDIDTAGITKKYEVEEINLSGANSFFHFGAGFGDDEVDAVCYKEDVIEGWENDAPSFEEKYVIPGTSIKGTLAHRVAFHYNKKNDITIEKIIEEHNKDNSKSIEILIGSHIGYNNQAVCDIFGKPKISENENGEHGKLIIQDVYLDDSYDEITFNHNKIDRYTGGTIAGALFNEKVLAIDAFDLKFKTDTATLENKYLQAALNDLKNGLLPIGGLTNKGHGVVIEKL